MAVIAIDGGGTKTRVIISQNGAVASGEDGPSNLLSAGLEVALKSNREATDKAIANLEGGSPLATVEEVWAGFAGVSSATHGVLVEEFSRLYRVDASKVMVSPDAVLLASQFAFNPDTDQAVGLIAGTGSLAVALKRQEKYGLDSILCRTGGYGALLGDEGSGFYIGRLGIKSILDTNERVLGQQAKKLVQEGKEDGHGKSDDEVGFTSWQESILNQLGVQKYPDVALHSSILLQLNRDIAGQRSRVASMARTVMEAATASDQQCPIAREIIEDAATHLAHLVIKLKAPAGPIDPSRSILITSGSLMGVQPFAKLVTDRIDKEGPKFKHIQWVKDPALSVASALALKHL